MRTRSPLFILLFFAISSSSYSQVDTILNNLVSRYPIEKVYVHYDKDFYVAGETIWFKAYFNSNGMPSNLSTSFYLQLSDGKGNIIVTKKYPILGATSKGNIELPDSLTEGNYYVTAATATILGFGRELVHNKNFYILNPTRKPVATAAAKKTNQLKFLPGEWQSCRWHSNSGRFPGY